MCLAGAPVDGPTRPNNENASVDYVTGWANAIKRATAPLTPKSSTPSTAAENNMVQLRVPAQGETGYLVCYFSPN